MVCHVVSHLPEEQLAGVVGRLDVLGVVGPVEVLDLALVAAALGGRGEVADVVEVDRSVVRRDGGASTAVYSSLVSDDQILSCPRPLYLSCDAMASADRYSSSL